MSFECVSDRSGRDQLELFFLIFGPLLTAYWQEEWERCASCGVVSCMEIGSWGPPARAPHRRPFNYASSG